MTRPSITFTVRPRLGASVDITLTTDHLAGGSTADDLFHLQELAADVTQAVEAFWQRAPETSAGDDPGRRP